MFSMVQAGSMGLPFVAVRGLIGSDILKHRPDLRPIQSPFNADEQVVVACPIRPEVAVFHALKADPWGNAISPFFREDPVMARASRRVIVTAEEIVDRPLTLKEAVPNTFIPAIDVDAVAHVPRGAHPGGLGDLYEADHAHILEYLEAAKEEKSFQGYLDRYIRNLANHKEYLERVGLPPAGKGGEK
jgi:glutaconate CoA-transferase, subunit A